MQDTELLKNEVASWPLLNEREWEKLLVNNSSEERTFCLEHLLMITHELSKATEQLKCYRLYEFLRKKYGLSSNTFLMLLDLGTIGLESYQNGDMTSAEAAFSIMCDYGNSNGRNNYAYMIRRGEIPTEIDKSIIDAINLLRPGLYELEPFAFVNMAILFAINLGTDSDWKISDELMEKLPSGNLIGVQSWWEDVGNKGDIEGVLVHYFLLRHKKIAKSTFGDLEDLSKKLVEGIQSFPEWLVVSPRFKSLDDVFDIMLDDDFEDSLKKYLDNMPRTRESAEEILKEMTQWDEFELYKVLLQDFTIFLNLDEIKKTIQAYKKKFSTPLPSIISDNELWYMDILTSRLACYKIEDESGNSGKK